MKDDALPLPPIETLIHRIRGQRVMLSADLARLYGVPARVLMQAVRRNAARFPPDFMFPLDWEEIPQSRSQFVILKRGKNFKYRPHAFTEQGVAMLSSVLRSERAVEINIAIMRAFVRLRETLSATRELAEKLAEVERRVAGHDEHIQALFDAIRQLMTPPEPPPKQIGFHVKESGARYGKRVPRRVAT